MAAVTVREEDFREGSFPPICAVTGGVADTTMTVFAQVPASPPVAGLAILLGGFGGALSLLSTGYSGRVPVTSSVAARRDLLRRSAGALAIAGVLAVVVGALGPPILVGIGLTAVGAGLACAVAASLRTPSAVAPAGAGIVTLAKVHPRFVTFLSGGDR